MSKIYPFQLEGLDEFIEDDSVDLWDKSHGIAGLWRRWLNRVQMVRLCQLAAAAEVATPEELKYVTRRAVRLTGASIRAVLWYSISFIAPRRARASHHDCLRMYRDIAYQTFALLNDGTERVCAEKLAAIL